MQTNQSSELFQPVSIWKSDSVQNIDFIVTEDCNLRCKYCYICKKRSNHVMSFEVAKKFIDYLFSGEFEFPPAVVLEFIGGEPLIEVELIDKIVDYFKLKAFEENSDWYWNYRISLTTNGVNYSSPKVRRFIEKNRDKMSLTITLDGTKEKHDMNRVFPDGSGSYDIIEKNIPLYIKDFYPTTKVTFSHNDLPLLKESIIHLWNLGIVDVSANCVYENVWHNSDPKIFEDQLIQLADYMIENELYRTCTVSFFDSHIGFPLTEEQKSKNVCGAGYMLGLGPTGKIYPCMRYKDYSLENKNEVVIGDINNGIDIDKIIRFRVSSTCMQSDSECLNCEIASLCSHCQAQSYDVADTETNFQRSKALCNMHKARVRANYYYFNKLYNLKGIDVSPSREYQKKLFFILDDDYITFCECENNITASNAMSKDTLEKGLDYCYENFYSPIFVHSKSKPNLDVFNMYTSHRIQHIISAQFYEQVKCFNNYILVFDNQSYSMEFEHQDTCILNVSFDDIQNLSTYVLSLFKHSDRINLNLMGVSYNANLNIYESELEKINNYLYKEWKTNGIIKEFNKLTDVFFSEKSDSCNAGENMFALAPNSNFYICPSFYLSGSESIGNLIDKAPLKIKNQQLYSLDHSPLCISCPAKHCVRCAFINAAGTQEVNVPPQYKCNPVLKEYAQSVKLYEKFKEDGIADQFKELVPFTYTTPFEAYVAISNDKLGYHIKKTNN